VLVSHSLARLREREGPATNGGGRVREPRTRCARLPHPALRATLSREREREPCRIYASTVCRAGSEDVVKRAAYKGGEKPGKGDGSTDANKDVKVEDKIRRYYRMQAVAVPSERVTRHIFARRGFANMSLIYDWDAIVGSGIGYSTRPIKIVFPPGKRDGGNLVVKVATSSISTELLHQSPLILERVNRHFGYLAVTRLTMRHIPFAARPPNRPAPPPPVTLSDGATAVLEAVEDPELQAALKRLGGRVAARK
jgi:hypothetical protein